MLLSTLLENYLAIPPLWDRHIQRLTANSRQVKPRDIFIALRGEEVNGEDYMEEAIELGAIAILIDSHLKTSYLNICNNMPIIGIKELARQLPYIAAKFYHFPARQLKIIGITGTSGKTSCSHFIANSLHQHNIPCGVIGTLGAGPLNELKDTSFTTPDALSLQNLLHQFVNQSLETVVMEVSSHAIELGRVNGLSFEIGIFTNLSQDHLDFHGSLEVYAAVKQRFFTDFPMNHAIFNLNDQYGKEWAIHLSQQARSVIGISHDNIQPADFPFPILYAESFNLHDQGLTAKIISPWGKGILKSTLMGEFNLNNLLLCLAALNLSGIPFNEALNDLNQVTAVKGRMQRIGGNGQPLIIVDYAHKPDALEKVLQTLRYHIQGKIICIFGCGGNRDSLKRPLMARIAEKWADEIIVTNDNPRHENPKMIIDDILKGFSHLDHVSVILDRKEAIASGIKCADINDCVLIAGKGSECYQQIGNEKYPFDDVEIASRYLAK